MSRQNISKTPWLRVLAGGLVRPLGTAEPAAHQREMQHQQVEPPFGRVRHAELQVERRNARLRHDRAIEGGNGGGLGVAAKQPKYHGLIVSWSMIPRNG